MEIISVAFNVVESLATAVGRQFGYLFYYNSSIKDLQEEADKLRNKRVGLQRAVDAAKRNREVIAPDVESWLMKVQGVNGELEQFLTEDVNGNRRCLNGCCLNLNSRYSLSRRAKNKFDEVVKLRVEGNFERISTPAPPSEIGSMFVEVKGFASRTLILNEILQSLMDEQINMIGICGMGGVGKTTMVKEAIKIVVRENLFDEVVMAIVSQTPDSKRIQGEIADRLGLKLDNESDRGRAEQLHDRLKSSERVLVVLDDVWAELDFEEIGIPSRHNHNSCKIIVTSRSKDVLTKMKSQKDFTISILSEGEAWDLFMDTAGDSIKHPALLPIAEEVANECGGLPIAIVTVGKALGGKAKEVWLDARDQLRKSTVASFSEMDKFVFSRIRLSYSCLENEEYKSCFLLCCLFPEDFNISVESLVRYGVGLSLFKGIDSLYQARNRVSAIIDKLKGSFLLLDSDEKECVKLHDVVRDAAISIVSEGERLFLVRCDKKLKKWPDEDRCKPCTAISIAYDSIEEFPDALVCPKLELLHFVSGEKRLQENIPQSLFKGMEELKALTLQATVISSRLSSIALLKHLRILSLHFCQVQDISILGALENLEILSLVKSVVSNFEIGQLKRLRMLDLTQGNLLENMVPGEMSRLTRLEELYMREEGSEFHWPSIKEELKSLSRLKILNIHMPNATFLPRDFLFDNLKRFKISVGSEIFHLEELVYQGPNTLFIAATQSEIMQSGIFQLLKRTEILSIEVENLKHGLSELSRDGFPCLNNLCLTGSPDLEYLFNAGDCTSDTAFPLLGSVFIYALHNLREIWHGQLPSGHRQFARVSCFGNLTSLYINDCSKLKNVISASITKLLLKLETLEIAYCQMVEQVVTEGAEEEPADKIVFPRLNLIVFRNMWNLMGFYSGDRTIECPFLTEIRAESCPKLETFVSANAMTPKLGGVHIDSLWYPLKGDLNNTIREIFKQKVDPNTLEQDQIDSTTNNDAPQSQKM